MDKLRRWTGQEKPAVLPLGEWLVWIVCRDNRIVNEITRYPNVEF